MDAEYVVEPAILVMTRDGRSTVIYDPNPGTQESSAGQVHFTLQDDELIIQRAGGTVVAAVPSDEIERLTVTPGDGGGFKVIAQPADGDARELAAGIPSQNSAMELASALEREFRHAFRPPDDRVAAPGPPVESAVMPAPDPTRPFQYAGRWAGRALLMALAFLGLLSLLNVLWGIVALSSPATYEPFLFLHQLMVLGWAAVIALNIVLFLIWIVLVHRDLKRLNDAYPISPLGALARVTIPFVSLWGLANVFFTLADELPAKLKVLTVMMYVLTIGGNLITLTDFQLDSPGVTLYFVVYVGLAAVWIAISARVHKVMAAMEERYLPASRPAPAGISGELATPVAGAGETAAAPLPIQPERRGMSRALKIGLAVAALAACGIFTLGAVYLPRVVQSAATWFDDEFFRSSQIVFGRMEEYGTVTNGDYQISFVTPRNGGTAEVWLLITMETIENCATVGSNPCARMADDIARVALENYARIDELDGIRVIINEVDDAGVINFASSVDKEQSIEAWRSELGIPKESAAAPAQSGA